MPSVRTARGEAEPRDAGATLPGGAPTPQGGAAGQRLLALRVALVVLSVAAIAYGIASGEAHAVFAKGVRVCLECIGIA